MSSIVEIHVAFAMVEKKTLPMHMRRRSLKADVIEQEAAGRTFKLFESSVYLGGAINITGDVTPELNRRIG